LHNKIKISIKKKKKFFFHRELKRVAHHPIVFIITDNSSLSAFNNPQLLFSLSIIDELKIEQIRLDLK
jgi:hypothetical protein